MRTEEQLNELNQLTQWLRTQFPAIDTSVLGMAAMKIQREHSDKKSAVEVRDAVSLILNMWGKR